MKRCQVYEVSNNMGEGTTVLTREELLRDTVMNVSTVHGIDSAMLYRGVEGLMDKYESGVVFVHDEIRSRPDLVMDFEKKYVDLNKEIGINYDIYEQVLMAAKAFDPDGKEKYTNLLNEIRANKKLKKERIENDSNGYNSETKSVIGSKVIATTAG